MKGWLFALLVAALPAVAAAAPADDARQFAAKGAESFKTQQYYEAAVAFEKAAQLDPSDPKNLRYAGRAWQEVGHLRKALLLLEAYLKIETDPALKASAEEKIAPLRALTSKQVLDALLVALAKYPQARLEPEAARAYEEIGDEASLKKAVELWEVAKVRAAADSERTAAENGHHRASQRLFDLKAKREKEEAERKQKELDAKNAAGKGPDPGPGPGPGPGPKAPEPAKGLSKQQMILYGSGGALAVTGIVLAYVGYTDAVDLNTQYAAYNPPPQAYYDAKSSADFKGHLGVACVVAGAGLAVWGYFSGPESAPAKTTGWFVAPELARGGALVTTGLRF